MQNLPIFSETCTYCYNNIENGITFCCDKPVCTPHLWLHKDHTALYTIQKLNDDIYVESNFLTEDEIKELKRFVLSEDYKKNQEIVKVNCKHINDLVPDPKHPFSDTCCANGCDIKTNLYMCLICGYQGCGRVQYGSEGNGHALDHYESTKHFINVNIESIKMDGSNNAYCYLCDNFVKLDNLLDILSKLNMSYADILKSRNEAPLTLELKKQEIENKTPYVGIENMGNTCYISACLQLFANNDKYLDDQFVICDRKTTQCFLCQFIRIKNGLNGKQKGANNLASINISEFVDCVENELVIFQRPMQNDANEFLFYLLQKIQEYQSLGELTNFTDDYEIVKEEMYECECGSNTKTTDTTLILSLPYKTKISESYESFVCNNSCDCKCGKKSNIKTVYKKAPKYLIICLLIEQNNLELNKFVYDINFVHEQTLEILDNAYNYVCNVIHTGENVQTGHYIAKYGEYYINDDKITLEEIKGYNYIFMYEKKD